MKRFYMAVYCEQDRNANIFEPDNGKPYDPGYYAFVVPFSANDNLKSVLNTWGGLKAANMCETKKQAEMIVNTWNDGFKANGTWFFSGDDTPKF